MSDENDETIERDFTELQEEYEDVKKSLQRTHADFQNYKKRMQERRETERKQALQGVMKDLLPILDNMSLALENADSFEDLHQSMKSTFEQLQNTLQGYGLEEIPTTGFDPSLHEVVLTQPVDKENHNTIQDIVRTGYTLHDKTLRSTQVTLGQHKEEQDE